MGANIQYANLPLHKRLQTTINASMSRYGFLRKNDMRRRLTLKQARAISYTLTRMAEKCDPDLFLTLLVEAGEAWAHPKAGRRVQFYVDRDTGMVRYRAIRTARSRSSST